MSDYYSVEYSPDDGVRLEAWPVPPSLDGLQVVFVSRREWEAWVAGIEKAPIK